MVKNKLKDDNRKYAIYSRKSKFTGKGESVDNQIEICKSKLKLNFEDIDLESDVIVYEDEGFSGANTKRPSFQRLLQDIRDKKIKSVFFYRLDRISRNVSDFCNIKDEFEKYDVSFFSASENFESVTPGGRAMIMMTSIFSQLERDTIAERIRDNMIELAKTGRWLGGTTPTGFKSEAIEKISVDGKKKKLFKLSPISDEINMIKLIFDKFIEYKSQTGLETYLIQNNIKTRNNIYFSRWGLKNILTNPVYAIADSDMYQYYRNLGVDVYSDESDFNGVNGIMAYNKTEQKSNKAKKERDISDWIISVGKHKGIISGKDFILVQETLNKNADKRYRKPIKNNALLSGLLRCSHCGSYMRPKLKTTTWTDGSLRFDYMCELKEKSHKQKCDCKNINGNEADKLVMDTVKDLINPSSKFYKAIEHIAKSGTSQTNKTNNEIKSLESKKKKNESLINSLLDKIKYVDISLLEDITNEIKKLRNDNEQIEKNVFILQDKEPNVINDQESAQMVLNIMGTYFTTFDTLDLPTKRSLLKLLISSVESDGHDLTLNLLGVRNVRDKDVIPLSDNSK
ncbi:MAG: recombinase family protein [Clostridia bacterium]|nr:recombinase family protein [Clostridia bacterium]